LAIDEHARAYRIGRHADGAVRFDRRLDERRRPRRRCLLAAELKVQHAGSHDAGESDAQSDRDRRKTLGALDARDPLDWMRLPQLLLQLLQIRVVKRRRLGYERRCRLRLGLLRF
jgi:hypothetical protein